MAKQTQIEKISPRKCITSLEAYHEAVMMLVTTCKNIYSMVDDRILDVLKKEVENVETFYGK